jgi:hypothetical protein
MELQVSLPPWEDRSLLSHTHRLSKNLKLPRNLLCSTERMMSMALRKRRRCTKNLLKKRFSKNSM